MSLTQIQEVASQEDLEETRRMFIEYQEDLGFALCFQKFKKELSCLPGEYAPPSGCILLAKDTKVVQGCIAVRDMGNSICEMKRFYVRPVHRGSGIGKCLVKAVVSWSKKRGYDKMRLDFVSPRPAARSIYEAFGFQEIAAYETIPFNGAVFMELKL
jgi:GNAT superfamily N-acetyltransferase